MKTISSTLAAVIGLALVAQSCEIIDKDPVPTTVPAQSVVLDGKTYAVVAAEIEQSSMNDGIYDISLYLSEGQSGCINIVAYREHEGKNIDLADPESQSGREVLQIKTLAGGRAQFTAGTFYIKRLDKGTGFEIVLRGGSFTDSNDGSRHTVAINFKGVLTVPVPENSILLDGDTYPVLSAIISKNDLDHGNYDIYLYISKSDFVRIGACKARHNGVVIDLTKTEAVHDGWSPIVEAAKNGKDLFRAYLMEERRRLFTTGTLYIYQGAGTNFQIRLSNGTVTDPVLGDGEPHSIEVNYGGVLTIN